MLKGDFWSNLARFSWKFWPACLPVIQSPFSQWVNCSIFRQISFEDEIAGCSSVDLKLDKAIAAHGHCWKYLLLGVEDITFRTSSASSLGSMSLIVRISISLSWKQLPSTSSVISWWTLDRELRLQDGGSCLPIFRNLLDLQLLKMILSSTRYTFSSISGAEAQSTLVCCSAVITMASRDSENVVGSSLASGNSVGSRSGLHLLCLLTGDWRTPAFFYTSLEVKFVFRRWRTLS